MPHRISASLCLIFGTLLYAETCNVRYMVLYRTVYNSTTPTKGDVKNKRAKERQINALNNASALLQFIHYPHEKVLVLY